jgi:quinol monooxygenase YgiN
MAVKVILDFSFKADRVDDALALLKDTLKDTRAFEGNLRTDVWQDANDPAHIILYEEWEAMENDTAYREWRAGDGAVTGMAELVAGPPSVVYINERTDV